MGKAWGQVRYQSGRLPTDRTYTGQRSYASDFGLMYYNARWYDSNLGHFAQADNIDVKPGDTQSLDRFGYVSYNPVNKNDPTGNTEEETNSNDSSNLCAEHPDDPKCTSAKLNADDKEKLASELNAQATQESDAAAAWGTASKILVGVAITAAVVGFVVATGGSGALLIGMAIGGYSVGSTAAIIGGAAAVTAVAGYAATVTNTVAGDHLANQSNINTAVNILNTPTTGEVAVSGGKMYIPGGTGISLPGPALKSVYSAMAATHYYPK